MKYTYFLIFFLSSMVQAYAQTSIMPKYSSYSGRHFYVGFMQNEIALNNSPLALRFFITATKPTSYQVRIPNQELIEGQLLANDINEIVVPALMEARLSEVPEFKAIEIISEMPVSVYGFTSKLTTSDAYAAIPISRWGTQYVVMSYPNDQYDDPERKNLDSLDRFTPRSSQFMVIAAYDSTVISFQPNAVTRGGKQIYNEYEVVLDEGQTYLVQSYNAPRGIGDLTGTIVNGNKPFGLLSGHVRTAVPQTNSFPYDSKDHLVEMLPPTDAWGKHFISVPFGVNNRGDLFRIASIHPATVVTLTLNDGTEEEFLLNTPGSWVEITDINEAAVWRGNKPFQIVQYMRHTGEYGDSQEYDPCIVVLPPVEQYVHDILFLTPRNFQVFEQYREHRVALIFDENAIMDLTLDGQRVNSLPSYNPTAIPGTPYYWISLMLREGRHHLKASTGRFSGVLYGFGFHDSYAMALGNSLTNPFRNDSLPPSLEINDECGFINGFVHDIHDTNSTGIDFVWVVKQRTNNYTWDIQHVSDTATVISISARPINIFQDGHFEVEFYDKNSNLTRYIYEYHGIKINIPNNIQFDNLSWDGYQCNEFKIFNFGKRTMTLSSMPILNDSRLSILEDIEFPLVLKPNDTLSLTLCFNPQGDSTALNTNLRFYFDCNYSPEIRIRGNVQAPKIEVQGYDFGKVRIGETKCEDIIIDNIGNTDLYIDELLFDMIYPELDFQYETVLPVTLKPNEKLAIRVCFSPTDIIDYEVGFSAQNNFDIDNHAIVRGTGMAPRVESIFLDWKTQRIGTRRDTTLYFRNIGNDSTHISFVSLINGEPTDPNALELSVISDLLLQASQEYELNFEFAPNEFGLYNLKAEFESDWHLHEPIIVEIVGEGTLPTINTHNFRFEDTRVLSFIDSTAMLIEAGGNEQLTIDWIRIAGGDIGSFVIDLEQYDNRILNVGEEIIFDISFTPYRAGEHFLYLEVQHDANPNFERSISTIEISGFANPVDTIDYQISIAVPDVFACLTEEGYLEVSNIGNVDINLQSIDMMKTPNTFTADFIDDISEILPLKILPGESAKFDMLFYAERNKGGQIIFDLFINDSINRSVAYDLHPIVLDISLETSDILQAEPGEIVSLMIKGWYPMAVEPNVDFSLQLLADKSLLELLSKNITMTLTNDNDIIEVPVELIQNRNHIDFIFAIDSLKIYNYTSWEMKLDFMMLLDVKDTSNLAFSVFSDRCFDPGKKTIPLKIINVCNFPLRPIKLIANLPFFNIAPNPIIEKIKVEVFLTEDDEINLVMFDGLGKSVELERHKRLTRGKHYLEYDASNLAPGVYNMTIMSKQLNGNNIFIITK